MSDDWRTGLSDLVPHESDDASFLLLSRAAIDLDYNFAFILKVNYKNDNLTWDVHLGPEYVPWNSMCKGKESDRFLLAGGWGYIDQLHDGDVEKILVPDAHRSGGFWRYDDDHIYTVTDNGLVIQLSGDKVKQWKLGVFLTTIHGLHPNFACVVGEDGFIAIYNGNTWVEVEDPPTNQFFTSVYCESDNSIYVTGWKGTVYHWDGKLRWRKINTGFTKSIYDVLVFEGKAYLAHSINGVFEIQSDGSAVMVCPAPSYRLFQWGEYLVSTGLNTIAFYDRKKWKVFEINIQERYREELERAADELGDI